jgi:hypothetical protein
MWIRIRIRIRNTAYLTTKFTGINLFSLAQDVMRKYKASVAAVSTDQITIQDQQASIQELEDERNRLREQLAELSSRLSCMEGDNVSTAQHKRLEQRF